MANKGFSVGYKFILSVIAVVGLSWMIASMMGGKGEKFAPVADIVYHNSMTVLEFGISNNIDRDELKQAFRLKSRLDLLRPLTDFVEPARFAEKLHKERIIALEEKSKNWYKILIKFILWGAFMGVMFWVLRTKRITARKRRLSYLFALVLFGIVLGADPSPMGTVKDAIALYGSEGVVFVPRMIALGIFLLAVVLANKFICGWGCQFGALQDFLFRLNRNSKDRKGLLRQYKPPFWISNSIRIVFFALFVTVAFIAAVDLIEPIDPFKIFKPMHLGMAGMVFVAAVLVASLFTYRPWCHFFCPFGLVGWLFEKVSVSKISVDYNRCKDGCVVCEKACPSDCMEAILRQQRTIPDCFACGTCLEACPTQAIGFNFGRRNQPPQGKFTQINAVTDNKDIG